MNKLSRIILFLKTLVLLAAFNTAYSQDTIDTTDVIKLGPEPVEFVFRPKLSLGIGMFTFYGDVGANHNQFHPTVSRIAYELKLVNPLTDYLDLNFYALFGQVSANERTLTRNLNFNSNITTGGLTFTYNFKNFSDFNKTGVNPFISAGFESIEFLSKSDLQDANGNQYHYWEDGRIMNLDENDINAASAFEIFRDYTYESDLRELDIDGNGKYSERSWAFPIEVGASFKVGTKMDFRVSTAMHFTLTDLIDNVTAESIGSRAGTEGNDKFLYTSASFTYDLTWVVDKTGINDPHDGEWLEYYQQDTSDYDKDGVGDFADLCAKTPIDWQPVDERGCPLDEDKDGVPDHLDNELGTLEGAPVDTNGVAFTDEDYFLMYRMYKDSIGEFSYMTETRNSTESEGPSRPPIVSVPKSKKTYTIVVGNDSTGVTQEQLYKLLGNKDFEVIDDGDQVTYRIGNFDNLQDVVNRLAEIEKGGLDGEVSILETDSDGGKTLTPVDPKELPEANGPSGDFGSDGENIYKVQIGAFSKKLSDRVFSDVSDLDYIKGEDGLWRYYSGTFDGKQDAAKHRVDIIEDGYNGSFIVAFKSGQRLTLKEAGYDVNPDYNDTKETSEDPTNNAINKDLVKFKVQVGAFANKIPTDILDVYLKIGNVIPKKDPKTGLTKYYIGTFSTYAEAEAMKKSLEAEGLKDAFVVGDFNGTIITASDALEIIK